MVFRSPDVKNLSMFYLGFVTTNAVLIFRFWYYRIDKDQFERKQEYKKREKKETTEGKSLRDTDYYEFEGKYNLVILSRNTPSQCKIYVLKLKKNSKCNKLCSNLFQ